MHSEGVMVFEIAVRESESAARDWKNSKGLSFPVLIDPSGSVYRDYGGRGVPHNIVINRGFEITLTQPGYQRGLGAIKSKVNESLNLAPFTPQNLVLDYPGGGTFNLSWQSPFEADLAGFEISYGKQPGLYTDTYVIDDPTARSASIQLTEDTYYFVVHTKDKRGNFSQPSNEVTGGGAVIPYGEILLNKNTFMQGDTMSLKFRMVNPTSENKEVDIYIILEFDGVYYFLSPANDFTTHPAKITSTLPPGYDNITSLFDVPFTDPLPQVCGYWHMGVLEANTVNLWSLDSIDFCFQ